MTQKPYPMIDDDLHFRPQAVVLAVRIVWVWIAFLAVSGVYDSWVSVPKVQDALIPLAPYGFTVGDSSLFHMMAAGYVLAALTMAGTAIALGAGKKGARTVLAFSFAIDFISCASSPPETVIDYIITAVDIGLQAYALWLVYTKPGSLWFRPKK